VVASEITTFEEHSPVTANKITTFTVLFNWHALQLTAELLLSVLSIVI